MHTLSLIETLSSKAFTQSHVTSTEAAMADNWAAPSGGDNAWAGGDGCNNNNGNDWNAGPAADGAGDAPPVDDAEAKAKREEFQKRARDAGWTESTAFDYTEFQRTGGELLPHTFTRGTGSC